MKRKAIAWTAAILIAAAVAACFLRPAPKAGLIPFGTTDGNGAYTLTEPVKIELIGKDADKFEMHAYLSGGHTNSISPEFYFSVCSLDGNYYTLGEGEWKRGKRSSNSMFADFGYVERMGDDGWEYYMDFEESGTKTAILTHQIYNFIFATEDETRDWNQSFLPFWAPGHYRVMMTVREYIPASGFPFPEDYKINYYGSSGEETFEIGFEYAVPERGSNPLDVIAVHMLSSEYNDELIGNLDISLRANGAIRYAQTDTAKLEQFDKSSGKYLPVEWDNAVTFYHSPSYQKHIENILHNLEMGVSYDHLADFDDFLTMVPLGDIILRGINTEDRYRFSIDFSENPDGSGQRYTLELPLKFSN